jgi:hypothetical protein
MTDRALLELAAMARGFNGEFRSWLGEEGIWNNCLGACWNPLENDTDALELAVNLGISIGQAKAGQACVAQTMIPHYSASEPYGLDALAATRRAIVRAAAEIGKDMK